MDHRFVVPNQEVRIRKLAVGLLAIAAVAAASLLLTRRRREIPAPSLTGTDRQVDDLYAAGL